MASSNGLPGSPLCPACGADIDLAAENCFACGRGLYSLTKGSVLDGRYRILGVLGKGGMGLVYKAEDHRLDEVVAVKVLRSDMAASADVARRFRSEIRLARRVRHKNVCAIHEYGEVGHLSYIAMEFVEGVDLRRLLRERAVLSWADAFDITLQVANGLQAVHECGIVHRDLKTTNIMLGSDGIIRLMDFGIAKRFEAGESTGGTGTGQIVGTPEYMSPEQVRGEKVDPRTDIYSLAVVTYELFTGDVPFRADTPAATLFKHINEPAPLEGGAAKQLPPSMVPVLRRALEKDRGRRHGSAHEFAEETLSALRACEPALERSPPSSLKSSALAPSRAGEVETTALPTPVPTSVGTVVPTVESTRSLPFVPAQLPGAVVEARDVSARVPEAGRSIRLPRRKSTIVLVSVGALALAMVLSEVALPPPAPETTGPSESPPQRVPTLTPPAIVPQPPASIRTALLPPPSRVQAAAGGHGGARLTWTTVPGATFYRVVVSRDRSLLRPLFDRIVRGATVFEVQELEPGTYYGRVVPSRDDGEEGRSSAVVAFTIPETAAAQPSVPPTPAVIVATTSQTVRPEEVKREVATPSPSVLVLSPTASANADQPAPRLQMDDRPGALALTAKPWAHVSVDGSVLGRTPIRRVFLTPGRHTLILVHPDYEPYRRVIDIDSAQVLEIAIDLRDVAKRRR